MTNLDKPIQMPNRRVAKASPGYPLRVPAFDLIELSNKLVILIIADHRLVKNMIAIIVIMDLLAKLFEALMIWIRVNGCAHARVL